MLELYVERNDGSSYCEAEAPNTEQGRRDLDRFAWRRMAAPGVTGVEVRVVEGRQPGYLRSRGNYR